MDIAKWLLLYLCMAIVVSSFFPSIVLSENDNNILKIFKVYYNASSDSVVLGGSGFADGDLSDFAYNEPTEPGFFQSVLESASSFFQSFVDGLKNVLGALKILGKFLFSPFIFIGSPEIMGSAPVFIKLLFALPLVLLSLIGLMKFIRGVQ